MMWLLWRDWTQSSKLSRQEKQEKRGLSRQIRQKSDTKTQKGQ